MLTMPAVDAVKPSTDLFYTNTLKLRNVYFGSAVAIQFSCCLDIGTLEDETWRVSSEKRAFSRLNVYPSCPGSNRLFTMWLPVKTVMIPSIQSGARAKCVFTSSKRFWSHSRVSAKANAAASRAGISEPHWRCQMLLLLCERWLECIYKSVSFCFVLFDIKKAGVSYCLVAVTAHR